MGIRVNEAKALTIALEELRKDRDDLLHATDFLLKPDYPLTEEQLDDIKLYRQRLRDLTEGLDTVAKVHSIVWPDDSLLSGKLKKKPMKRGPR